MHATIARAADGRTEVTVTDNRLREHRIALSADRTVESHACEDVSSDPGKRTALEGASLVQARRYARYHVTRQRGVDALHWDEDPRTAATTLVAVQGTTTDLLHELFDDYYREVTGRDPWEADRSDDNPESDQSGDRDESERGPVLHLRDVALDAGPVESWDLV
ncbi:hypothetical protein BRD00_12475 [Halobacteriales archaeon QS_8_69_26]|nr:MAG: hypothetical protein BRD00_12475 [Halobacteriales archaeon QS_8_69_26]